MINHINMFFVVRALNVSPSGFSDEKPPPSSDGGILSAHFVGAPVAVRMPTVRRKRRTLQLREYVTVGAIHELPVQGISACGTVGAILRIDRLCAGAHPFIRLAIARHLKTAITVLRACDKTLNGFSHQSKKDFVIFFTHASSEGGENRLHDA